MIITKVSNDHIKHSRRHVFGLWEDARVPGVNPCEHGENMQTVHKTNFSGYQMCPSIWFEETSVSSRDPQPNHH